MRKTSKTTAQRSQSVNEGQLRGKGTHSEQEQPPLSEGAVLQRLKRAPAKSGLSGQIFLWAARSPNVLRRFAWSESSARTTGFPI